METKKRLFDRIKGYDIFKNRVIFYIVPLAVILVMIACGLGYQFASDRQYFANIGIDFQGGTILTVEFEESKANSADFKKNAKSIERILEKQGVKLSRNQTSGESTIIAQYTNWQKGKGDSVSDADQMNKINMEIQRELFAMSDKGEIDKIADNGINFSTIGNQSSRNLLKTSAIAVSIALALMLLYIVIRFDFYSGLAAVIALLHDIAIMLSLTVIFYVEIGDSIVAGLITIVAYSINNTIVVFDRIRTVVKPLKQQKKQYRANDVINGAIFTTMTRTLYTTLTTLVVMIVLVAMGVASIRTFGLPIIFGLIAGFYSSVFIAAPLWGEFKLLGDKIKAESEKRRIAKRRKARA